MAEIILSYYQTQSLRQAKKTGMSSTIVSPDLGMSEIEVRIDEQGVIFGEQCLLDWQHIARIHDNPQACFKIIPDGIEKVQHFSEAFNRLYSLMPTTGAPTMLISGIPMHRIKGVDPMEDTLRKIKVAAPKGQVLDTATGLGYTALLAARTSDHITTIELDPTALDIARQNPWSRALFESANITQRLGDSYDLLPEFEDNAFDRIIHDPPMFSLAGHLYSADYYRRLHRILKRNGRLFHYVGDPNSKSGRNITSGVLRRLQEAGFKRVIRKPRAFGVVAFA